MKQRYEQDQPSDAIHDAWSAAWGDPALQDLGRRLDSYGLPVEQAAMVVEQIWLYYSYEALLLLRERVPMGIASRAGDRPHVCLFLPFRADDVSFLPHKHPLFLKLNRVFHRRFEEPLKQWIDLDLDRRPLWSAERLPVRIEVEQDEDR